MGVLSNKGIQSGTVAALSFFSFSCGENNPRIANGPLEYIQGKVTSEFGTLVELRESGEQLTIKTDSLTYGVKVATSYGELTVEIVDGFNELFTHSSSSLSNKTTAIQSKTNLAAAIQAGTIISFPTCYGDAYHRIKRDLFTSRVGTIHANDLRIIHDTIPVEKM